VDTNHLYSLPEREHEVRSMKKFEPEFVIEGAQSRVAMIRPLPSLPMY
jgi:hypothetical protein